ncbi:glycosyltransferase family 4 protein [Candidatus Pacearchaeota archaeon]|nr:glycosyltransferase family 4 protein [Candidatus Pacearchaeota archaeon]
MNLLHITPSYPPLSSGGIESQVKIFAESTPKPNTSVIIAPSLSEDSMHLENNIKVYRTKKINPEFKEQADYKRDYNYFISIIEKEKINKILAHNLHAWINENTANAILDAAHSKNIPVYLRVHNYCRKENINMLNSKKWKKYLCVSKSVARQIISLGIKKGRVKVLYVPIEISSFFSKKDSSIREKLGISKDSILILQASRIVGGRKTFEEKGVLHLINLFAKSENKNSHLLFCIAKTIKSKEKELIQRIKEIEREAERLNVKNKVHVISLPFEKMYLAYNNADIFMMMSKIETFGGVYAEAMACEIPVIGTSVGGIPEVIKNNKSGFIVKTDKEAVEKLNLLIKDRKLRQKMGKFGREYVIKNFGLKKITRELMRIIK